MASNVNDISIRYEEDGQVIIDELDKIVLSKGAWSTIIYKYRQWNRRKEEFGPDKFTIRRYRKINDEYRQQSKFNISSVKQANKIIKALQIWVLE